jgi:hypothetical protein
MVVAASARHQPVESGGEKWALTHASSPVRQLAAARAREAAVVTSTGAILGMLTDLDALRWIHEQQAGR